jgi:ElaB protein
MADSTQTTAPGSANVSSSSGASCQVSSGVSDSLHPGDGDRKATVGDRLEEIRDKVSAAQDVAKEKARAVYETTDDFVHDSPWKAVSMGFLAGLVIGMLAAR